MKAIVHIGMAKTGSSTVQEFLDLNRQALAQRGFRYDRHLPKILSQVELAVSARARAGDEIPQDIMRNILGLHDLAAHRAFADRFEAEFARRRKTWTEPVFVASSEHLGAWVKTPQQIAALQAILAPHFDEIRFVVYLRRQEELVLSSYSEKIKRGSSEDFETHLAARKEANHFRTVRRWQKAAGAEALTVRLLERDMLKNGDLVDDFCAQIGLDPEGLARPQPVNESLSAEAAELMRRLNRALPWLTESRIGRGVRTRIVNAMMRASSNRPRHKLTPAQFEAVRAANAQSNARLCAACFPERPELFPPHPEKIVEQGFEPPSRGSLPLFLTLLRGQPAQETGAR